MRTVLRGGDVFDASGAAPAAADVVIEEGRIVAVGPGLDGDDDFDCSGRTIVPGFIDSHVHFMGDGDLDPMTFLRTPFSMNFFLAAERMARTLAAGVTTVREAGGSDLGVKEAQVSGLVPGPSMLISITILSQTGGHGDSWQVCGSDVPFFALPHPGRPSNVVDGPEEMRRKVRELVRAGADVIKVCTSGGVLSPRDDPRHGHFRDDELDALVAEANAAGKWVMSHAQATDGIKAAVRAGIRSIEHGIFLDDEAIEMMLARGTYLVPTLVAPMGVLEAADRGVNVPQYAIDKTKLVMQAHRDSIAKAIAAGVKVAMGTDSGVVPHGQNLRELEQMTSCGMSPTDALIASTRTAAELLGVLDDRGTVESGKRADLVVLDGDPLDVSSLGDRIHAVFQNGRLVFALMAGSRVDETRDGVDLTHLDQPLFEGAGASKRELVDYLDAVRDRILPVLRDRPLSVIRVTGDQAPFMQKNLPKYTPEWVARVDVWAEASHRTVSYGLCNDRRTLLWFGNQRAVELHPALTLADDPEHMTHLILDLDPPSPDDFAAAVAAARLVRAALESFGLVGAVKTSGAKGVHVFVPIAAGTPMPDAAAATRAIARRAELLDPATATTAFIKEDRGGKVFVDSTRAGGATVVAAYSRRARPGVPVSFPVAWDELDDIAPGDFTLRTAIERLGERDPWAEAMPPPQALPEDLLAEGHAIPIARVAAMHEGKRRARSKKQ